MSNDTDHVAATVSRGLRGLLGLGLLVLATGTGGGIWAAIMWAPNVNHSIEQHGVRLVAIDEKLAAHVARFVVWDAEEAKRVAADAAIVELCKSRKLTDEDECDRAGYVVERARIRLLYDPVAAAARRAARVVPVDEEEN